jgi:hypothetical protein
VLLTKSKDTELSNQLKDINKMIFELQMKSESFLKVSNSKNPLGITSAKKAAEIALKVQLIRIGD